MGDGGCSAVTLANHRPVVAVRYAAAACNAIAEAQA